MVAASDHVLFVIARSVPPTALASVLADPTVRRTSACWTFSGATPVTWKRRKAWRTGELAACMMVAVPNTLVAAPESTYVSATGLKVMVAGTTFTVTVAVPVAPSRSVTVAVIVCVPAESEERRTVGPVPRAPSRLEVQRIVGLKSPSSVSRAVAPRTTGFPTSSAAWSAGEMMVTTGVTLSGRMTTVVWARPRRPPVSFDTAMIVCVPVLRRVVEKLGPVPIGPSRLEIQRSVAPTLPSVASIAVAPKGTLVPAKTRVPVGGAVIETTGAVGVMVTWTCAEADARSVSVMVAVSTWLPSERRSIFEAPVNSAPSTEPGCAEKSWPPCATTSPPAVYETGRTIAGSQASLTDSARMRPVMVIWGAAFGPRTRIWIWASPVRPSASVTEAVIVCRPMASPPALMAAPEPSGPARSERHWMVALRSPSSTSVACPVRLTGRSVT